MPEIINSWRRGDNQSAQRNPKGKLQKVPQTTAWKFTPQPCSVPALKHFWQAHARKADTLTITPALYTGAVNRLAFARILAYSTLTLSSLLCGDILHSFFLHDVTFSCVFALSDVPVRVTKNHNLTSYFSSLTACFIKSRKRFQALSSLLCRDIMHIFFFTCCDFLLCVHSLWCTCQSLSLWPKKTPQSYTIFFKFDYG